jgi:hypothetical protein
MTHKFDESKKINLWDTPQERRRNSSYVKWMSYLLGFKQSSHLPKFKPEDKK